MFVDSSFKPFLRGFIFASIDNIDQRRAGQERLDSPEAPSSIYRENALSANRGRCTAALSAYHHHHRHMGRFHGQIRERGRAKRKPARGEITPAMNLQRALSVCGAVSETGCRGTAGRCSGREDAESDADAEIAPAAVRL